MSDFDSELAKTPLRPAPADWRGEILRVARSAATEAADRREEDAAPGVSRWRWMRPQRLALAAAWAVIAVLRMATPAQSPSLPTANVAAIKTQLRAQQGLVAELLHPANPVSTQPRREGATRSRRKGQPV